MDKHGNRFLDDKVEPTKIIDLDEANITEEWDESDDIDSLYEANEIADEKKVDEPTRLMKKVESSEKSERIKPQRKKEKDKDRKNQERIKEKNSKKLEKLMKKQRRKEEKSDRDVLSYEDMPLEEREKKQAKKTRKLNKKRIIALILVLVVLFGVVFVFTNSDKLSWHHIRNFIKYGILNQKSDEQFPVSVQGENVNIGNFARMGQDICYASDTKLEIVNNYGRYEYSNQHGFINPVLAASDKYAMIFSLGGSGFQINTFEKTVYSGETDERIVTADINDKGIYALVTTSNGYLSKLRVYDKDNEKIFGYSFASYYVTAVSLSPNGKSAVVTGISALNGTEISSLYVLDFTKDKPTYVEEVEDNIFYDVQFLNDTYACAVGNADVSTINIKNGNVNTTEYEGRTLTAYTFNRNTNNCSISLSRSGDGRNCEILSFQTDGRLTDSFETEYMVRYISTYKGRIALMTPDVIYLYSKNGNKVSENKVSNEPKAVVLYTTSDAYVLDTNEINSISL